MAHDLELIYQLEDRPPLPATLLAAVQHVLASFIGIITPTLVISGALGLAEQLPYLLSMALFVSGLATFIQVKKIKALGSGMLSIQGTSFSFVGGIIAAGLSVKNQGGSSEQILATLFGVCLAGSFIEMLVSRFLGKLKRIITPTVTGIVVCLIGLSLIKVGMTDVAGGFGSAHYGEPINFLLAGVVFVVVLGLQLCRYPWLRLSALFIGLVVGCLVAAMLGQLPEHTSAALSGTTLPVPFKYGLSFDWQAFLPISFIFIITAIETVGDLTATSRMSSQPIDGPVYVQRLRGGVLGDGFNSLLAAVFNTFPNTTFSQNNGVIQLTGVASRYVGLFIAALLILLGLIPGVGSLLQIVPRPVLGATTTLMFGAIAVAGIRILTTTDFSRKSMLTIALSFGLGLGVTLQPDVLQAMPEWIQKVFSSAITTGGLTAILCSVLLPEAEREETGETTVEAAVNTAKLP